MKTLKNTLKQLTVYPSAVVGLAIILILLGVSVYAVVTIPYSEAVRLWRGGEEIWYATPKTAGPVWLNLFTRADRAETIVMSSQDEDVEKSVEVVSEEMTNIDFSFPFEYRFEAFPEEITVFFTSEFADKAPHVSLMWLTPDGREIKVGSLSVDHAASFRISQDKLLQRKLKGLPPHVGLFADPDSNGTAVQQGTYELQVNAIVFEPDSDVDAELVVFGQLYGLAGTDHRRRDLTIALLWGTPIALAFGLLAALGTTMTTMSIAGIGTWFGGWVDGVIQRITEVNMVLPFLPILIMIGTFYSKSIWLMLGATILLSIFGGAIKTYRAIFLQVKESPYMEAAKAYGATNSRMIFTYLIPRIIPMLIPQLVILIPTFVFIEAALAVLGLGDPVLPTWGKVINDAQGSGALFQGQYYWVLEPAALLMVTGLAFSLLGFALDRVFNPRLRGM